MMLILDFELKENSNESPLLSLHDADVLLTWRLAKEFCYLPAKYKKLSCMRWGVMNNSNSQLRSSAKSVISWPDLCLRSGFRSCEDILQWCLARKRPLVPVERRNANRGWMQTFFLLVRCFGKFKWHLWYRLVKLQWESICRSAGTSLTISGFLWNVLIAANFFFFTVCKVCDGPETWWLRCFQLCFFPRRNPNKAWKEWLYLKALRINVCIWEKHQIAMVGSRSHLKDLPDKSLLNHTH